MRSLTVAALRSLVASSAVLRGVCALITRGYQRQLGRGSFPSGLFRRRKLHWIDAAVADARRLALAPAWRPVSTRS